MINLNFNKKLLFFVILVILSFNIVFGNSVLCDGYDITNQVISEGEDRVNIDLSFLGGLSHCDSIVVEYNMTKNTYFYIESNKEISDLNINIEYFKDNLTFNFINNNDLIITHGVNIKLIKSNAYIIMPINIFLETTLREDINIITNFADIYKLNILNTNNIIRVYNSKISKIQSNSDNSLVLYNCDLKNIYFSVRYLSFFKTRIKNSTIASRFFLSNDSQYTNSNLFLMKAYFIDDVFNQNISISGTDLNVIDSNFNTYKLYLKYSSVFISGNIFTKDLVLENIKTLYFLLNNFEISNVDSISFTNYDKVLLDVNKLLFDLNFYNVKYILLKNMSIYEQKIIIKNSNEVDLNNILLEHPTFSKISPIFNIVDVNHLNISSFSFDLTLKGGIIYDIQDIFWIINTKSFNIYNNSLYSAKKIFNIENSSGIIKQNIFSGTGTAIFVNKCNVANFVHTDVNIFSNLFFMDNVFATNCVPSDFKYLPNISFNVFGVQEGKSLGSANFCDISDLSLSPVLISGIYFYDYNINNIDFNIVCFGGNYYFFKNLYDVPEKRNGIYDKKININNYFSDLAPIVKLGSCGSINLYDSDFDHNFFDLNFGSNDFNSFVNELLNIYSSANYSINYKYINNFHLCDNNAIEFYNNEYKYLPNNYSICLDINYNVCGGYVIDTYYHNITIRKPILYLKYKDHDFVVDSNNLSFFVNYPDFNIKLNKWDNVANEEDYNFILYFKQNDIVIKKIVFVPKEGKFYYGNHEISNLDLSEFFRTNLIVGLDVNIVTNKGERNLFHNISFIADYLISVELKYPSLLNNPYSFEDIVCIVPSPDIWKDYWKRSFIFDVNILLNKVLELKGFSFVDFGDSKETRAEYLFNIISNVGTTNKKINYDFNYMIKEDSYFLDYNYGNTRTVFRLTNKSQNIYFVYFPLIYLPFPPIISAFEGTSYSSIDPIYSCSGELELNDVPFKNLPKHIFNPITLEKGLASINYNINYVKTPNLEVRSLLFYCNTKKDDVKNIYSSCSLVPIVEENSKYHKHLYTFNNKYDLSNLPLGSGYLYLVAVPYFIDNTIIDQNILFAFSSFLRIPVRIIPGNLAPLDLDLILKPKYSLSDNLNGKLKIKNDSENQIHIIKYNLKVWKGNEIVFDQNEDISLNIAGKGDNNIDLTKDLKDYNILVSGSYSMQVIVYTDNDLQAYSDQEYFTVLNLRTLKTPEMSWYVLLLLISLVVITYAYKQDKYKGDRK